MFSARTNQHTTQNKNTSSVFQKERSDDFIQPKLKIGKPGDQYEVEADQTADKVVDKINSPKKEVNTTSFFTAKPTIQKQSEEEVQKQEETEVQEKSISSEISPLVRLQPEEEIQEKCETCEGEDLQKQEEQEVQEKEDEEQVQERHDLETTPIQKQSEEEPEEIQEKEEEIQEKCNDCEKEEKAQTKEEEVQQKEDEGNLISQRKEEEIQEKCNTCEGEDVQKQEEQEVQKRETTKAETNKGIESQLTQSRGSGSPLVGDAKTNMESGFGADFSKVRIHTDSNAVQMSQNLGAQAFTNKNDIYFNEGKYNPNTKSGQHLLAHELTHTVQQSGGGSAISPKLENTVQLAEDPCKPKDNKGGSEEKAKAKEEAPPASCTPKNPPAEQPAEGQEEPDKEESPKAIGTEEGASLDERQGNAPPPDHNAPKGDEDIQKNAQDNQKPKGPCDQAQGAVASGAGASAAGAAVAATANISTAPPKAEGAPKGDTQEKGKDNAGDQKGEGKKEGEGDFLMAAVSKGVSATIVKNGLGEEASPELLQEKEQVKATSEEAFGNIEATQGAIAQLNSGKIAFVTPENKDKKVLQEHSKASENASSFLANGVSRSQALIAEGMQAATALREQVANKKLNVQTDIANKKAATAAFFATNRANAEAKAQATKMALDAQHTTALSQIELNASLAVAHVEQQHQLKVAELDQKYAENITAINEAYKTGHKELIDLGNTMAGKVNTVAKNKERSYKKGEGASASDKDKIVNKKKDGFWDGYLTYNRWMARADSAKEVGKQYADGMKEQAKSKADFMLCGKGKALDTAQVLYEEGTKNLQCSFDNSIASIEKQRQAATMQAMFAQQELTKNIDNSLQATMNQLEEKEASQFQLINDYSTRQLMAIEKDGENAITTTLNGVNDAAIKLLQFLTEFKATITSSETPEVKDYIKTQEQLEQQFELDFLTTQATVQLTLESATVAIDTAEATALSALNSMYYQGINDGRTLMDSYNGVIDQLHTGGMNSYNELITNSTLGFQGEQTNATNMFGAIVAAIVGMYDKSNEGIKKTFKETAEDMKKGMQKTIDEDLEMKICAQAEKAAADVQPWWKTALKILLVIVVIVIVIAVAPALIAAIGPAIAGIAGSLGASAALAGSIGAFLAPVVGGAILGAVSGAVIQVGNNLIDVAGTDKELTWESVTKGVWGAVVAGAIGGALGGLGGQFAQVIIGRFGAGLSGSMQTLSTFGIETAFDVVGTVLGDLAAGNPITWEGLLIGVGIGAGIQIGTSGLGSIASSLKGGAKVDVNAPKTDVNVPKTNVDVNVPKADVDVNAPKTDVNTPKADTDVNTPRTDTDVNTPKTDADGKVPKTKEQKQDILDDNRSKKLSEMTPEQRKIDLEETGNNTPKKVAPDSEFAVKYDVEIESNGHTYRRRKDGKGWCRFSAQECGIKTNELPAGVQKSAADLAPVNTKPKTKRQTDFEQQIDTKLKNGDITDAEAQVLRDYNNANPSGRRTIDEAIAEVKSGRVINPDSGSFHKPVERIDGVPREKLPEVGSPEHKKWEDYLAGKSPDPCFPAGTLVATPNGLKPIEAIKINDTIWSYDHVSQLPKIEVVTDLYTNWAQYMMKIKVADTIISATPNHPFWEEEEKKYLRADELLPGMMLRTIKGELAEVIEVEKVLTQEVTYNFEAGKLHNYYVGETSLLVHNEDAASARPSGFADTKVYPSTIYVISDLDGKVIYVGQTIQDFEARYTQHLTESNSSVYQYLEKKLGAGFTEDQARLYLTTDRPVKNVPLTNYELSVQEQHYIDKHGGPKPNGTLENKINAITPEKKIQYANLHNPCQ